MAGRFHNGAAWAGAASLLIVTPLALGSVYGWTYRLVAAAAFALLAFHAFKAARRRGFTIVRTPVNYLLPALAAFVVLQAVPLPTALVHAVSPGRAALDSAAGVSGGYESLALYPWAALDKGLFAVSLVIFFLAVLNRSWTKEGAVRLTYVVIALGTVFAAAAVARSGDSKVEHHFLPYINKNHFAGYLEAAISLAVAAMVYRVSGRDGKRRARAAGRLMGGGWPGAGALLAASVAVMFAGLIASLSRGGLIALAVSLLVTALISYGRRKKAAVAAVAVMFLVVAGLAAADVGKVAARLGSLADVSEDGSAMLRLDIWKDTARMVSDYPAAGVGLGGYGTAYPFYKSVRKYTIIFQPESDYLYVLAEGGVAGAALAGAFLVLVLAGLVRVYRGAKDTRTAGMAAGALAAMTALLVHGFVDTNLHIPANAFLATVLAALAMSFGAEREGSPGREGGTRGSVTVRLGGGLRRGAMYLLSCLSLLVAVYAASGSAADLLLMSALHEKKVLEKAGQDDTRYLDSGYGEIIRHTDMAGALDPGRVDYPFEMAMAYNGIGKHAEALGSDRADDLGLLTATEYYDLAYKGFMAAEGANPYNAIPHLLAGWTLAEGLGDRARGEAEYLTAERINPTFRLIKQVLIEHYAKKGDMEESRRRSVALALYDPENNTVTIKSFVSATPQRVLNVGDVMPFTADAKVIVGGLEYKYCVRNRDTYEMTEMTGFIPENKWTWDTSSFKPGKYRVLVVVRGAGGKAGEKTLASEGGFVLRPAGNP